MYANKTILRCALIGDGFSVVNGRILASIWGAIVSLRSSLFCFISGKLESREGSGTEVTKN